MKEVQELIDNFSQDEALAYDAKKKPDYEFANQALRNMHQHTISALAGQMGLIYKTKNESDEYYEKKKNKPAYNPRHLFKISHYNHQKYGEVWIAYVSTVNPDPDIKLLSHAFFIVKEDGDLKIARIYIYSNQRGMSTTYDWEGLNGYQDLTFESLGELIEVNRILEPLDYQDSLKLYLEEK
ncbi:hypothetical protein U6A24_08080 [Aquimarina gracilis]|uniref:Uncharacterized protein n=1 Tax=Aquimarina gracilis TaxID=874422 RepID=A0ABU5ZUD7_9FLAO|nr:hypothetical protein [Aquimarina gracilis]MEB3345411.1 hypothetical protein [Aquimarina gracilis]